MKGLVPVGTVAALLIALCAGAFPALSGAPGTAQAASKSRLPTYYQMFRPGFSVTLFVRKRNIVRVAVRSNERCRNGEVVAASLDLAKPGDYVHIGASGRFAYAWRRGPGGTVLSGQISGRRAIGIYRDWESDFGEGGPCGTGRPGDRTLHFNAPRVKHVRKPAEGFEPFARLDAPQ